MTMLERRTLAAGLATGFALAALFPVFHGAHWFVRALGAVAVVTLAGLVERRLRLPRTLQPLVSVAVLCGYLILVFAHGTLHHGVPTTATVTTLRDLVTQGRVDIRLYAPPVIPTTALVLIATAGAGAVAVLVDLIAVVLDRVVLAGLPLLALFAVPSAVLPGGLGGVVFAVGATGWLILLLEEGSERVGRWGTPMRSAAAGARPGGDDTSLGRVGRRIGAAALGLAVIVPALVPGLDHRLLGGGAGGNGHGEGASNATTYNPITRLRDQLTLPKPRQLFVYSTDDALPDYLRMTTLDLYTGAGWASSKLEADRDHARVQDGVPQGTGENGASRDISMRIAVDHDHLDVHWLPVPFGPRKVDVQGTWLWDPTSQTVFSASRTTNNLPPYTVTASRPLPSRDTLAAAAFGAQYPGAIQRYTTKPGVTRDVATVTQQIVAGKPNAYDRAIAIQAWFTDPKNHFVYDFNASQPAPGQDPLEAFLTGRHGFCEQFATAMGVMLRIAGVPSRVAVGFTAGQRVPGRKGIYSVTTSDAHAWPEAWFPGTGWVRFEPTPGAAGATIPDYSVPAVSTPNGTPTPRPSATPSGAAFPRGLTDPDTLLKTPGAEGGAGAQGAGSHLVWALLLLPLAVLGALPWCLTHWRRRRRARHPDPLTAWAQVQDDVTDIGLRWHHADSPRAVVARLGSSVPPPAREPLHRLAAAAELARYAPPGRTNRSAAELITDGTAVRRALLESVSGATRWRARLLTPSTLRWAGHTAGERVADVLDAIDRGFTWVGRPFRRVLRARV